MQIKRAPHESERLYTAYWIPEFAEASFKIYGDAETVKYFGEPDKNVEVVREKIINRQKLDASFPEGIESWAIFEKTSDELIGNVILRPLDEDDPLNTIEIGWHIRRDKWNKGFATEIAKVVANYALYQIKVPVLYALVDHGNFASNKICEKLGMTFTGLTEKYYDTELEMYSVTPESFPEELKIKN